MRRADFSYELPSELIAQHPPAERGGGRLLRLDGAGARLDDLRMADFPRLLRKGDLLVLNDTRVIPARVHGAKPTGGQVEILLERVLDGRRILAHVHTNKSLRPEVSVRLPGGVEAHFVGRQGDLFELELSAEPLAFFQAHGEMPLPPYIEREIESRDGDRYQTVFAREWGAVAAPTAGLHFDQAMLQEISSLGVERASVTLHVGAGTFQSVRVDNLDEHRMHRERVEVDEKVCAAVAAARARGGRVVAVGTTVVRSLESAARDGVLKPLRGETDLFIRPGFEFNVVDAMLTNFHLPESTLLMLVCAFAGYEKVMAAYRHAVEKRYRFFSYGDAMFVTPTPAR